MSGSSLGAGLIVVAQNVADDTLAAARAAAPGAQVLAYRADRLEHIPQDVIARADAMYVAGDEVPLPESAPRLRWVQSRSAGVDAIVRAPLFMRGDVALTTASGVHGINISEYVLMMMLAFAHRLPQAFAMMRRRRWSDDRMRFMPDELFGATLGLIGYGGIGKQVARSAGALGMRVMVMRGSRPPEAGEPMDFGAVVFVPPAKLGDLLAAADYVVLAVPLTRQTYHLIDAAALARMKPTAVLINVSRGDVVDESALIAALQERRIAGAGLDVFSAEPLPSDSPLWRMEQVILTPHIAGVTPHYERRAAAIFAENLRRFAAGEPLVNQVDFERGY